MSAKNNGLDFDFGKQFGSVEAQLAIITKTLSDLDLKIGLFDQKLTEKIDSVDSRVMNLAKRTGDLEHKNTSFETLKLPDRTASLEISRIEFEKDYWWFKFIGGLLFTFLLFIIGIASGVLQDILSNLLMKIIGR